MLLGPEVLGDQDVVAMVMPLTMAINAKIPGKLTETDANALAPRKRPTQMLSSVLCGMPQQVGIAA